ncbi:hypothetical protein DWU98_04595 [Dyella monticola]|uniref:Uncharacterized protein n=1 Tax=Dyella monticola TaxID=1927958 RepID=A0A370X5B7_9GAMM|nr:hypothetical protein [Dyella monticola]RDS83614.1 hypothetical protein DWU98_04595 [Dyella monticola]
MIQRKLPKSGHRLRCFRAKFRELEDVVEAFRRDDIALMSPRLALATAAKYSLAAQFHRCSSPGDVWEISLG